MTIPPHLAERAADLEAILACEGLDAPDVVARALALLVEADAARPYVRSWVVVPVAHPLASSVQRIEHGALWCGDGEVVLFPVRGARREGT